MSDRSVLGQEAPLEVNAVVSGGARRDEILDAAARLIGSAGVSASITEIADAAGVQAGSLYHHFASKEAILVELVRRYLADVDAVARDALRSLDEPGPRSPRERVEHLGSAIAACATRNRAALLILLYEPPSDIDELLVRSATQSPPELETAMHALLRTAGGADVIRAGVDAEVLADQLCRVLLHVSLGELQEVAGADEVPSIRCRILLDGLAVSAPSDAELDRSSAYAVANRTIEELREVDASEDERLTILRSVASAEFGRRGYEATTMRNIAAAAGMSKAGVGRLVGSKEALFTSILRSFAGKARQGWRAVIASDASPVEKLDALMWFNLNVVDRFRDEYHVQLACLRDSPPSTANLGVSHAARMSDLKTLLAQGRRSGELVLEGPSADIRAWALFELLWMPENLVQTLGSRGALAFVRNTVLRGALGA